MDFEKNPFFPCMYVTMYDNVLDIKFATFEHIVREGCLESTQPWNVKHRGVYGWVFSVSARICSKGQLIREHRGFPPPPPSHLVVRGDPGRPGHPGLFLTCILQM